MKTESKFTIQQYELNRLLNVVKHAVATKPALPILDCLKIDVATTARYITITASDHVNIIKAKSNPDSIGESKDFQWSMCVPAKTLINLVALLPGEDITFTYSLHNRQLSLQCAENTYSFGCQNPQDFPKLPEISQHIAFELESDTLSSALEYTSYAISTDSQKPNMCGLFIGASLNKLTVVSTDGKKLVRYIRTDVSISDDVTMLIPRASVGILEKILPKNGNVTISTNGKHASIDAGYFTVIIRQIDERYPNFDGAINVPAADKSISFFKTSLTSALNRLHLLANTITPIVTFELTPDSCRITTQDIDMGRDANEYIELTEYPHESINISFRLQDLEAILSNIDTREVKLSMESSYKSAYFYPSSPMAAEDILVLVVPYLTATYA